LPGAEAREPSGSHDADASKTYTAVGVALTQWEFCEMSFGALYSAFVKPTGGNHIVLRVYGTILAAGTRREMIEAAAEVYFACFPDTALAAARRNEIAHGVVMGMGNPSQFFLIPSFFATKKRKLDMISGKYQLGAAEIDTFRKGFSELSSRALKLMQDVRNAYQALPEKHREQFA
jgi:hypothetical protein